MSMCCLIMNGIWWDYSHAGTCQSSTERSWCSVQLTVTFYFSKDFEEVSIHVFLSRLSWTIFAACQVYGLKPSFSKFSRGQQAFYNMPKHTIYSSARDPSHPAAQQQTFFVIYTHKNTRVCSAQERADHDITQPALTTEAGSQGTHGERVRLERRWSTRGEALWRPTG